jgi:uncharacterized protein YdiU (UPF0061 family)
MTAKLGLDAFREDDTALVDNFLQTLEKDALDLTLAYRWLTHEALEDSHHTPMHQLFKPSDALLSWRTQWARRRATNKTSSEELNARMVSANPVVIPRNHQVAAAIADAEVGDYQTLHQAFERWQSPFSWEDRDTEWAATPSVSEQVTRTFCGT